MRRIALICAGLALTAIIVSAYLWPQLHDEREPNSQASVTAPDAALQQASTSPPSQPVHALETSTQEVQKSVRAQDPPDAAALIPDSVRHEAQLLKDPEFRDAEFAQVRRRMASDYPGIAEELNLSEQQVNELFDLLANGQLERRSANVFTEPGSQPDIAAMEEMARKRQDAYRRQQDSLAALLGTDKYDQFKQFEAGRVQRVQAHNLGRTLASAGQPLSSEQQRHLTTAFVTEDTVKREQASLAGGARDGDGSVRMQGESNQRLIDALKLKLSAEQIEVLQGSGDDELAQQRAELRVRQQRDTFQ